MIKIGVRAHDFGKLSPDELFARIADAGFDCVQLAFPKAIAGVNSFEEVTPDIVKAVDKAAAANNIEIAVVGCYQDLATTNATDAAYAIKRTINMMNVAKDLGAYTVASESSAVLIPEAERDEACERVANVIGRILKKARELDMRYSLEPVFYHAVTNKERFFRVLRQVGAENFHLIYDPTNMMDPQYLETQEQYMNMCLDCFSPYIGVIHYKDFTVDSEGKYHPCRLGDGRLSPTPVKNYLKHLGYKGCYLIREELEPQNAAYEVEYLKKLAGRA